MRNFVLIFVVGLLVLGLAGFAFPEQANALERDRQVWRDSAPAQPMNQPSPPQLPGAPTQTPIGSGLGLLLAAGGAYAIRRLRSNSDGN
ncbi:MAG: hypothetical protein LAT75_13350 [Candidatus Cyclonatronum sp.]|uniref:PID-CTERM protein-sorting domain-containing protein n=1 Tax=Cyclonatronum sp. TaxID=3024185 RepID=UPI0025BA9ABD|nr:hypothetical protein [Cyclonatronum sp.]MCH8487849.1 hypothetical protein [Cyclonatronum sp.]